VAAALPAELQDRLLRRVAEAERQTRAEFVTVVVRRACPPSYGLLLVGGLLALALPGLLWALGLVRDFPRLYLAQLGLVLLFVLLQIWPPAARLLQPRGRREAAASALAQQFFAQLGLHRTGTRGGVLLFVALDERYLEVVADDAAALALPDNTWTLAVEVFRREAGKGDLDGAFALVLQFLGERLGRALPRLPSDLSQPAERLIVQ